ncbi:hypothetical protein [Roseobacter sp. HKCCA2468]|uniref:hypothetical protein n=1 Tax=Roseobacter sp. HKCCA2468 TaxID=3120342 RepID=UPI0030EF230E
MNTIAAQRLVIIGAMRSTSTKVLEDVVRAHLPALAETYRSPYGGDLKKTGNGLTRQANKKSRTFNPKLTLETSG